MRAAALQFDVTPDLEHNLDFVRDQLHVAAAAGIQLVVLPEMWASSFPSSKDGLAEQAARERQAVAVLRELSEELELCLAGSALVEEQGEFYNRLQVLDAGRELLRYDKVHLFSPTAEKEFFTAGSRPPDTVVSSAGRVSGAVCYDLRFPELFRVAHREGVEVFVLPAQWPQDRALHWRSLVIGRAIENQCFFSACTSCSGSPCSRAVTPPRSAPCAYSCGSGNRCGS